MHFLINYLPMSFVLIMNTCPDQKTARKIAENLINEKLAACVNIMPAGLSVYRWQGKVESAEENLLLIKTHENHYPKVETMIQNLHPYELPEIIVVPITSGLPDYLSWISENVDMIKE